MDPISKKQLQYEEDGNEGSQKIQCDGGEATLTIAEGEMIGEDDDYNELYGDINIGEGLQFQVSEAQGPSANGAENDVIDEDEMYDELYGDLNIKEGYLQFHLSEAPYSSANGAMKTGVDPSDMLARVANEYVPLLDCNTIVQFGAAQMPPNHSNDKVNVNHQIIANDNPINQMEIMVQLCSLLESYIGGLLMHKLKVSHLNTGRLKRLSSSMRKLLASPRDIVRLSFMTQLQQPRAKKE